MTAIAFRFLAGRYHATSWDHHVNEGVVEWPPAPWRILRALVAASFRLDPVPTPEQVDALVLGQLARPPSYRLPRASLGHTRHYMPLYKLDKSKVPKTTRIFDAFAAVGKGADDPDGELAVYWPEAELTAEQEHLLDSLLVQLAYLGRAESWVEARRLDHDPECNAWPVESAPLEGTERVEVLAPQTPEQFDSWRQSLVDRDKKAARHAPKSLGDALRIETSELQKRRWSRAPGTRRVPYVLLDTPFWIRRWQRRASSTPPSVAWYEVSGPVKPRILEAVTIGDRVRKALMSRSQRKDGTCHPVFSGRRRDGRRLDDDHTHARCLPVDTDGDGRIDHVAVCAQGGFDVEARRALEAVRRLWGPGGHELHLVLVGLGRPGELGGACPVLTSRVWESHTPFVLFRHPKRRNDGRPRIGEDGLWIDGPRSQLLRALRQLGLPEPVQVEEVDALWLPGREIKWHRFRRERLEGGGCRVHSPGHGFRIVFHEPQTGPIALGYGAHQGLGLFLPAE